MSEAYAAFIEAQLAAERAQRESINTRAASLLTTAVSVSTLAVAVLAVFKGTDLAHANFWAKILLLSGLILLFGSASFAMLASRPIAITTLSTDSMYSMVQEHWDDSDEDSLRNAASANVVILEQLRPGTARKNSIYLWGTACQIAAIVFFTFSAVAQAFATTQTSGGSTSQTPTTATSNPNSPPQVGIIIQNSNGAPSVPTVFGRG